MNRIGKTKNGIDTLPVWLSCDYGAYSVTVLETKKYGKEREIIFAQTDFDFPSVARLFGSRCEDDSKGIQRAIRFLETRIDRITYIPVCALDQYPDFEVAK